MSVIIFKATFSALMKFIQQKQILGKISAFVWRIEYQKTWLPHTHILFWTDFDTQNIPHVEVVINVRYSKRSTFFAHDVMVSDFR
jgi:hypothetical protein